MSRTDKTQPWWCQVTAWEPFHACMARHIPCDLPPSPPRSHNEAAWWCERSLCGWQPVNWHEVTFPRVSEWYMDKALNRTRAKRSWRKDWGL